MPVLRTEKIDFQKRQRPCCSRVCWTFQVLPDGCERFRRGVQSGRLVEESLSPTLFDPQVYKRALSPADGFCSARQSLPNCSAAFPNRAGLSVDPFVKEWVPWLL